MAKQTLDLGRRWYVLHTYSGYEENVKRNLEQRIASFDMQDKIFSVMVPKEKKIKIKNGKRQVIEEKVFPGYVLVEMVVTDDSWYVVRNTPNVKITDGPFKNFEGKVSAVDEARGKIKVLVSMFGRETPVELDALQVKKV